LSPPYDAAAMSATYLITGGAGNLACQLTFHLARRSAATEILLADIAPGPVAAVAERCRYVRCDLTDRAALGALLDEHRPRIVLHFASLLSGSCETNRELAWRVNIDGAFGLMELALRAGVGQIFFPSSVATFGPVPAGAAPGGAGTTRPMPEAVPEEFAQWPSGLYGVTKVAVERLGVYYHRAHALDFRCLRVPIVVSAHAPAGAASAFASRLFVDAATTGRAVCRAAPSTRASLIYVKDILRAMDEIIHAPADRLRRRVYHVHGLSPTAEEMAEAVKARLPGAAVTFEPDPKVVGLIGGWPAALDDAAARAAWGWRPAYDLASMADDLIRELTMTR
jgi:nucleoside-diphosphate-sugar epimerase